MSPSTPRHGARQRAIRSGAPWLVPAAFLCALLAIYLSTAQTSSKVSVDVYSSSLSAWRIAQTGEPWLDGLDTTKIDGYGHLPDETVFIAEAPNGHRVSHRLPGVVAAAVPAYWIRGGGTGPRDFSMAPEAITAALVTAGAVMLLFLAMRRPLGDTRAIAVATVVALGTPLWSVAANAMWTHTLTVFGIFGMTWAASRERWWLVGAFGGIAIWGRLHVALIVAAVGIGVAVARRNPRIALQVGTPSAAFLGLACLWTHWVFGSWIPGVGYAVTPDGLVNGGTYPDRPSPLMNQMGLWVSPDKGILIWTPLLLLLLPAVMRAWRELPDWARWLAVGALPYMVLQGQMNHYTGGGAHYGYRLGLEFLAAVAPAYILSAHRMKSVARAVVGPMIGVQVAAIAVGAVLEAPTPEVSYGWTDNAFLVALRLAPALGLLVALLMALMAILARAWRDLTPRPTVVPTPPSERLVRTD